MNNLIIVIIAHNEKKAVINNIQMLGNMDSNCEVIVVDNHSSDGLHEYLAENHMNFIYCDEGIEGYAKILNIVCQEFVQDYNCNLLVMRVSWLSKRKIQKCRTTERENGNTGGTGNRTETRSNFH